MLKWNKLTLDNDSYPPNDTSVLVRGENKEVMAVAYMDCYGWVPDGVTSGYDMSEPSLDFTVYEWAYIK